MYTIELHEAYFILTCLNMKSLWLQITQWNEVKIEIKMSPVSSADRQHLPIHFIDTAGSPLLLTANVNAQIYVTRPLVSNRRIR